MFAWICPKCGSEVPPSEPECPRCTAELAAEAAPPSAAPTPMQHKEAPRKRGLPAWLLTLLFAIGFLAVGSGAYYGYVHLTQSHRQSPPAPPWETPAATPAPKQSAVARYIEVARIRLMEDARQKVQVQCLVVNHSGAEIAGLEGTVTLRVREGKAAGRALGSFAFRLPSLGPYESREIRTALDTNLRAYEIPDWQFVAADVVITAP